MRLGNNNVSKKQLYVRVIYSSGRTQGLPKEGFYDAIRFRFLNKILGAWMDNMILLRKLLVEDEIGD